MLCLVVFKVLISVVRLLFILEKFSLTSSISSFLWSSCFFQLLLLESEDSLLELCISSSSFMILFILLFMSFNSLMLLSSFGVLVVDLVLGAMV